MRFLWMAAALAALLLLFPAFPGAFGLFGPDEPRYASIAREMARSGDWVTPVLDGKPWLEKPALLYWMGAVGFKLGLGPGGGSLPRRVAHGCPMVLQEGSWVGQGAMDGVPWFWCCGLGNSVVVPARSNA
ncbi:MAG: ArnT family glycosyltransferase [Acidobacteriota bacterium]